MVTEGWTTGSAPATALSDTDDEGAAAAAALVAPELGDGLRAVRLPSGYKQQIKRLHRGNLDQMQHSP